MAGIYIHIPFCKQACHYCNFHFSTVLKYKNEFIEALLQELVLRNKESSHQNVETIYFGGGTPGILSVDELERILNTVRENYNCTNVLETTIEMNPDDVTEEKLRNYKRLSIDRISLGVQSFFDEDLVYMNRSHTVDKALDSIQLIDETFNNYTVDLIYGYPLLTDNKLESNVSRLVDKNVPHISIYGMTVEPKTALDSFIRKGSEKPLNPEQGARQFEYLMNQLNKVGYDHYEISSYAKNGFKAIHNSNYWAGKPYLGFGPGAHSYQNSIRSWNIANNALYIKSLSKKELNQEQEILSQEDILNELVMLGLRVKEGLSIDQFKEKSSVKQFERLLLNSKKFIEQGVLERTPTHLKLTKEGKLFCDMITSELFQ